MINKHLLSAQGTPLSTLQGAVWEMKAGMSRRGPVCNWIELLDTKNKYNTVYQLCSNRNRKWTENINRKDTYDIPLMPGWPGYLPLAQLGWVLSLDCPKAEGEGMRYQERNCLRLIVPGPSSWDHSPHIQAGDLTSKPGLVHPKDDGASRLQVLWGVTWSPHLLGLGFPPAALLLTAILPIDDSPLTTAHLQGFGFALEEG